MFQEAYRRRCIVPVDGFFEWQATRGGKQPYAIAMKDGSPFGLAGLWENWKDPSTGEWVRTFAIITVPSNDLVGRIHDRMPAILRPRTTRGGSARKIHRRHAPFPCRAHEHVADIDAGKQPENDDRAILEPIDLAG